MSLIIILVVLFFVLRYIYKKEKEDALKSASKPVISKKPVYQFAFNVWLAGTHVASRKNYIINNLYDGAPVKLEHEPTNKHDPDAIKVLFNDTLIGYIPSDKTNLVHPIIQKEHSAIIATIDEEDSYKNPGTVHLTVYLEILYN